MNLSDPIFHDDNASRAALILKGAEGKRLTYRRAGQLAA
jgi:hypothetical protein